MFIDIVGFSVSAERQTPAEAFGRLSHILRDLGETIRAYGGVMDRAMGDGLLAYFSSEDQANRAFACAMDIQTRNLHRALENGKNGEPVYPFRIGINSAFVYLGSLPESGNPGITLIGHGVNYARRLEAACEPYCIMVGATTRDLLQQDPRFHARLMKRFIRIKQSYNDQLEVYECDPFEKDPLLRAEALAAYRRFSGAHRREVRWGVPEGIRLVSSGDWGTAEVTNFSESGLAVLSARAIEASTFVDLKLDSGDGELQADLESRGLLPLVTEARWCRPHGDGRFLVGLAIRNLNPDLRAELLLILRRHVSSSALPAQDVA